MGTNEIIGSDRIVIWIQPEGAGTPFEPYAVGKNGMGMTGKSIPGRSTTPVYARDEAGRPLLVKQNIDAPGSTPSATLSVYERGQIDVLRKAVERGCEISVQSRITLCSNLVNPNGWTTLDHWYGGVVGDLTLGDGPALDFDGTHVTNEAPVTFSGVVRLVRTALSALTTSETQDLLDIAGLADEQCNACGNGYPGADKLLFIGSAAAGATTANLLVSTNGGGLWTPMTNDPFAADEDISDVDVTMISTTQLRILAATNTTDAAAPAKFAYSDVTLGDEVSGTWTTVSLASTSTGDVINAFELLTPTRLYIASGGDIYISTDRGSTDPGAAVYTGTPTINGFSISPDGDTVWAFGATNTLLREQNKDGSFVARTAPSGGADFTALAVASDGTIYAGNGTSLYKSIDQANSAGNWTELIDFGSNYVVQEIQLIKDNSQLIRVVVDNTVTSGQVYESIDGGATFNLVTEVTNAGYNAAYFSKIDANKAVIVGDVSGGLGVIQELAP